MTKVEDVEVDRSEKARPAPMMVMADQYDDDGEASSREEYERLLALYEGSFRNIAEGEVITGTVLKVSSSEVMVMVVFPWVPTV